VSSRRRFLGWLAAGAAIGGAGIALFRTRGYSVAPEVASKLAVLAPWQYVVIAAFGERAVAPEAVDVAGFADGYLVDLAPTDRRDLLAFVAYLEHVAPLGLGLTDRFSRLSPDEQLSVMSALETSSVELLRAGFQGLKALAMMALYRRPESWNALEYGGPVVRWQAE
jgi:hypothetical protein